MFTLLLIACGGSPAPDDTSPVDDTAGDSEAPPCGVGVLGTSPAEGEEEVSLARRVHLVLDAADPSAELAVAGPDGPVAGRSWRAGGDTELWFQADAALPPGAELTATATLCSERRLVSFRTTELGDPVGELVDRGFLVDVRHAEWVQPPDLGLMLGVVLERELLLGATTDGAGALHLAAGGSLDGKAQDTCAATIPLPDAEFGADPWFQVGPADLSVEVNGVSVGLRQLLLAGEVQSDGASLGRGVIAAQVDMREVLPALGDLVIVKDIEGFCDKLSGFGIPCVPCADGSGDTCVDLYAEELGATALPEPFREIPQEDCDPACAASWDNPECDTSGW